MRESPALRGSKGKRRRRPPPPPRGCGGRAFASRGFGGGWRGPRPHAPVPASGELKAHGCFKSLLRPLPTRSCPRCEAQGCVSGTGPGGRSGQVTHAPRAPTGGAAGREQRPAAHVLAVPQSSTGAASHTGLQTLRGTRAWPGARGSADPRGRAVGRARPVRQRKEGSCRAARHGAKGPSPEALRGRHVGGLSTHLGAYRHSSRVSTRAERFLENRFSLTHVVCDLKANLRIP